MKTAPIFMSKEAMLNRLAKRNLKTIKNYTEVSDKIPEKTRAAIMPVVDSMARFCKRNECKIFFNSAEGLFENNISATIAKINLHLENAPWYYETYQPIMTTIIDTNDAPKIITKSIRDEVRKPLKELEKARQEALRQYYETHPYTPPWP